jgi:uncharacterized SAM-binding protein YcdF (DUF218 family)
MDSSLIAHGIFRAFLLPPACLFLLIGIGLVLRPYWPRVGKTFSRVGLFLLFAMCTPIGADLLVSPLEGKTVALKTGRNTGAQAIVVLAAGRMQNAKEYANTHIPDYIALARLRYAARLQHETGLPLLVSGGNIAQDGTNDSKAAGMARALREDFRTPVKWIEGQSESTAENATRSIAILQANGIQRILLVTDAMHMPRAELMFLRHGMNVISAPTMFFGAQKPSIRGLIPDAESMRLSYYATYEWLGLAWYQIRT